MIPQELAINAETYLTEWGGIPYGELSVILVHLRYVLHIHQSNHWTSKSDSFYADHLLLERIYNNVLEEIDEVAEKAIGLGTAQCVQPVLQAKQFFKLVKNHAGFLSTIPQPSALIASSLASETVFSTTLDAMVNSLTQSQKLSRGLDNLLAEIADTHEQHVYLLRRRLTP